MPILEDFLQFLTKKCNVFESIQAENSFQKLNISNKGQGQKRQTLLQANKIICPICNNAHFIYQCNTFLNMSINERIKSVKDLKICMNYFKCDCRATKYKNCGKSHNTLLHIQIKSNYSQKQISENNTNANDTCLHNCSNSVVLLWTALIEIKRSQANFVTNNLANKLQLNKRDISLSIMVVNNKQNFIKSYVTTDFKSLHNNFQSALNFLIIPEITQKTPSQLLNRQNPDTAKY